MQSQLQTAQEFKVADPNWLSPGGLVWAEKCMLILKSGRRLDEGDDDFIRRSAAFQTKFTSKTRRTIDKLAERCNVKIKFDPLNLPPNKMRYLLSHLDKFHPGDFHGLRADMRAVLKRLEEAKQFDNELSPVDD